jgi:hypothetical protein
MTWWLDFGFVWDDETRMVRAELPLWLLAAICLAWPVTSFILARRRHKRGFPIEPKGRIADSD